MLRLFFISLIAIHFCASALAASDSKITITEAIALPTLKGVKTGIGFMKVHNNSQSDVAITGAASDAAKHVELHNHETDGDIMRMRKIDEIAIPAGETVELKPGGLHLMFLKTTQQFVEGDTFWVELKLSNGDVMKRLFRVSKMTTPAQNMHHHH